MSDRSSSQDTEYTLDVPYPSRFRAGQSPLAMQCVAACAGARAGDLSESFYYLDLGCGNGSAVNLLAACYPNAHFFGIDISADDIASGQDRAKRAGLDNVSLITASFADLESIELPSFDYISVCGVYSWISSSLQVAIDSFLQQQLDHGGLVAVQYASLPGSSVTDPLANYLRALCNSKEGNSAERLERGLEDLEKIASVSRFFETNPQARDIVNLVVKGPPKGRHDSAWRYTTAHDILNRQLHSFYFAEVSERFASLGLEFLGSSYLAPNYPELTMSSPTHSVYCEIAANSDVTAQETTKDFLLNTSRRFDLFRKTDSTLEQEAIAGGLCAMGGLFVLRTMSQGDLEARRRSSQFSSVDLTGAIYTAVLDLAGVPAISIAELIQSSNLGGYSKQEIVKAVERLYVTGFLRLMVRPPVRAKFKSDQQYRLTSPLNRIQLDESIGSPLGEELASFVIGAPIKMAQEVRVGLLALTGTDLDHIWNEISRRQSHSFRDGSGNPITQKDQFRKLIEQGLPRFAAQTIPDLLQLGIVEACQ